MANDTDMAPDLADELAQLRQSIAARNVTVKPTGNPKTTPPTDWDDLLAAHGLSGEDTSKLLEQLTKELGDLPHNKPMLTAAAAFGLGFVLGRMSK
jgi:hypothetical protein